MARNRTALNVCLMDQMHSCRTREIFVFFADGHPLKKEGAFSLRGGVDIFPRLQVGSLDLSALKVVSEDFTGVFPKYGVSYDQK